MQYKKLYKDMAKKTKQPNLVEGIFFTLMLMLVLFIMVLFMAPKKAIAQELHVPQTITEPFIHIVSEKDGKINAVITCVKKDDGCISGQDKITIKKYANNRGYRTVYEYKPMVFSDVEHYVITVSK